MSPLDFEPLADTDVEVFLKMVGTVPMDLPASASAAAPAAAVVLEDLISQSEIPAPVGTPEDLVERMTATELLAALSEARGRLAVYKLSLEADLDSILSEDQRAAMAMVRLKWATAVEPIEAEEKALAAAVEIAVANRAESVKGSGLHAVYAPGRVTWDSKALDGYATGHPELLRFRKEGKPSVAIRTAK